MHIFVDFSMLIAPERQQKISSPFKYLISACLLILSAIIQCQDFAWDSRKLTHSRNVDEISLISVQCCSRHISNIIQRRLQYSKHFDEEKKMKMTQYRKKGLNQVWTWTRPKPRSSPKFSQMPELDISPVWGSPKKVLNRTEPDFGITRSVWLSHTNIIQLLIIALLSIVVGQCGEEFGHSKVTETQLWFLVIKACHK
jgi:hypothetical protein